MSVRPRTALITGAAAGIGQEFARRLAQAGYRLVLADVADCTETAELIDTEATVVRCDVASPSDIADLAAAVEALGGADILVNNAGIYPMVPFEQIDLDGWRRVQAINVEALFLLTRALLPGMRERRWGRIVAIASGMFNAGVPGSVHYVASKGAVTGFVRSLAPEIGRDGVTINAIAPGLIRTPGTASHAEGMFEAITRQQAVPRSGVPSDLSGALLFLVSEDAGFMTGQTLLVDGGVART